MTNLSHWTELAVTLAGVAAVSCGLVFVALSVDLERILRVAGLPGRAGETVVVFIGAVVQCAFLLIPALGRVGVDVGLLVARRSTGAFGSHLGRWPRGGSRGS